MLLDDIIKGKQSEIDSIKEHFTSKNILKYIDNLPAVRDFKSSISKKKITLIAEAKKSSPSSGLIVREYHPEQLAVQYSQAGASAISVLTEQKNFGGFITDIKKVREHVGLPVLRKDFIIDESQIFHSRISCADAVLLIVRILDRNKLKQFIKTVKEVNLQALVEVHTADEAKIALDEGADMIGINNRDLDTLEVDVRNTEKIINKVPELKKRTLVSESGIQTRKDVEFLSKLGIRSMLVGEALLRSGDISSKINELLGAS